VNVQRNSMHELLADFFSSLVSFFWQDTICNKCSYLTLGRA